MKKFMLVFFFLHPGSQVRAGMRGWFAREPLHFPSPGKTGSEVSAWPGDGIGHVRFLMLVHRPVTDMQGSLERQIHWSLPSPACPRSGPMKFLGTHAKITTT